MTSNERCLHGISLTANPPCIFCELRSLLQIAFTAIRTKHTPPKDWYARTAVAIGLRSEDDPPYEPSPDETNGDVPYHQMPQHIIDKAIEVRRWFDERGHKHWSIAGIGPMGAVETIENVVRDPNWRASQEKSSAPPGWCEVCGGQNGEHKTGCVDGDTPL